MMLSVDNFPHPATLKSFIGIILGVKVSQGLKESYLKVLIEQRYLEMLLS